VQGATEIAGRCGSCESSAGFPRLPRARRVIWLSGSIKLIRFNLRTFDGDIGRSLDGDITAALDRNVFALDGNRSVLFHADLGVAGLDIDFVRRLDIELLAYFKIIVLGDLGFPPTFVL
jgi:hypothetical protein